MRLMDLRDLADRGRVCDFLTAAAPAESAPGRLLLGLIADGRRFFAAAGQGTRAADVQHERIALGCLMKIITATLVASVVADDGSSWEDDNVASMLALQHSDKSTGLESVRLRQLLNHTHGLDDSLVTSVPILANGRIDTRRLHGILLSTRPLAAPGELYSYGSAGVWLYAAILEHLTRKTYRDLLFERLVEPLGLSSVMQEEIRQICPAGTSAGAITMSLDDALTFLEAHLHDGLGGGAGSLSNSRLARLRADRRPLPGWAPGERGICQGWKYYGSGWYGHSAIMREYWAQFRIHPATRYGLVFAGEGKQGFSVFARLFARVFPEFSARRIPRILAKVDLQKINLEPFEGIYCTGAVAIIVRICGVHTLQYQIVRRAARAASGTSEVVPLIAAVENVFFPSMRLGEPFSFLQFLLPTREGKYRYLWNGRCLWRRLDDEELAG